MKKPAISTREIVMLLFLVVLLVGVGYYMFFYQPLQDELTSLASQSAELDGQIQVATAKAKSMKAMQDELDEILSRPADQITEIAPYDNAKIVMSQLNGILSASENYNLKFLDPKIEDAGTVRRTVTMEFTCVNYPSAKAIVEALSASHWRCLINDLSVEIIEKPDEFLRTGVEVEAPAAEEGAEEAVEEVDKGILNHPLTVKASIVFFESTKLAQ